MEYIDGWNLLEDRCSGYGPPPLALTLEIARQSLKALGYLHRHKIVHRDVSPDNLMLTRDVDGHPLVKLIDLGIAKALEGQRRADHRPASSSASRATPRRSSSAAPAGTSAQRPLLLRRRPLRAAHRPAARSPAAIRPSLMAGHLFRPPLDFAETDPEGRVPPELRALVLQALAKKPDERIASAEAFVWELTMLQDRFPLTREDLRPGLGGSPAAGDRQRAGRRCRRARPRTVSIWSSGWRRRRRRGSSPGRPPCGSPPPRPGSCPPRSRPAASPRSRTWTPPGPPARCAPPCPRSGRPLLLRTARRRAVPAAPGAPGSAPPEPPASWGCCWRSPRAGSGGRGGPGRTRSRRLRPRWSRRRSPRRSRRSPSPSSLRPPAAPVEPARPAPAPARTAPRISPPEEPAAAPVTAEPITAEPMQPGDLIRAGQRGVQPPEIQGSALLPLPAGGEGERQEGHHPRRRAGRRDRPGHRRPAPRRGQVGARLQRGRPGGGEEGALLPGVPGTTSRGRCGPTWTSSFEE